MAPCWPAFMPPYKAPRREFASLIPFGLSAHSLISLNPKVGGHLIFHSAQALSKLFCLFNLFLFASDRFSLIPGALEHRVLFLSNPIV